MAQIYKVFINNRCFEFMPDAGAQANIPGTLVVNYDSAETLSLMIDLAHSESVFFRKVIILHNDPARVLAKIEHMSKVVNAAGGAVHNADDNLLMIYRNDKWDLPKGKMEKGETPEQSAVREVEEECGVTQLKIVRELPSTYHTYKINDKLHLKRTWWYEMSTTDSRKLIPQTEEGITKAEWLDKKGVETAKTNTYGSILEVLNALN